MNAKPILTAFFTITISLFVAYSVFLQPNRLAELSPTLATVTSILMAVSLAISALVSTPFEPVGVSVKDGKRLRVKSALVGDELAVGYSQAILFYLYLVSLGASLVLWWIVDQDADSWKISIQLFAGFAGFIFSFSFILSAFLPSLLMSIIATRRELSK